MCCIILHIGLERSAPHRLRSVLLCSLAPTVSSPARRMLFSSVDKKQINLQSFYGVESGTRVSFVPNKLILSFFIHFVQIHPWYPFFYKFSWINFYPIWYFFIQFDPFIELFSSVFTHSTNLNLFKSAFQPFLAIFICCLDFYQFSSISINFLGPFPTFQWVTTDQGEGDRTGCTHSAVDLLKVFTTTGIATASKTDFRSWSVSALTFQFISTKLNLKRHQGANCIISPLAAF